MKRDEKIKYLKGLQAGDKSIIEDIKKEKTKQYFASLSFAELMFLTDVTDLSKLKTIADYQSRLNKYRTVINEYKKFENSPVKIAVKYCIINDEPCFRFCKKTIDYLLSNSWVEDKIYKNTGWEIGKNFYIQNKEYIESRLI